MKKLKSFLRSNLAFILLIAAIAIFNCFFDTYIILTGSMEPTLKVGAAAVINPLDTEPQVGDIAAYRNAGNIVIHRVVGISCEGYTLKGDNNTAPDPNIIGSDEILGTLVLRINAIAPVVELFL